MLNYKQLMIKFNAVVDPDRYGKAMPLDEELEKVHREENMNYQLKRWRIK